MTNLTVTEVYIIAAPIVLAIILFEVIFSSFYNKNLYKKNDTLCTLGLLLGNILMVFALKGFTLGLHMYVFQFKLFNLSELIPVWSIWVLTFIMIDFVFYIYHRISHRVNFLWVIHMSHHSSEEMNFAVSFRQAWFGPISKLPFFVVLPFLGFDPTIVAVAGVISTLWGIFGHTQIINKLGPLEWFLNTPSHHRVHHGCNEQYIDKNYGNLFIVWDKIFGTFEPEDETVKYGLVNNVNTFNPSKITFMGWNEILRKIQNSKNIREMFRHFFGPPQTKKRI